ncbi:MAG: hypothetical protein ACYS8Y_14565, partial [Planctomycetota bacterium]
MSTLLVINTPNTPARKSPRCANPWKIQHFGTFSTHLGRRFFLSDPDSRSVDGHPRGDSSAGGGENFSGQLWERAFILPFQYRSLNLRKERVRYERDYFLH